MTGSNPYARSNHSSSSAGGFNSGQKQPPHGMNNANSINASSGSGGPPSFNFNQQQQQQQQQNVPYPPMQQQQQQQNSVAWNPPQQQQAQAAVPTHPTSSNPHQQQPQQQSQNTLPPQDNQSLLIESLRKQLEEKDEENFDLSASLSAVQVETNHRIGQVELESKQKINKLEEALRRAQQDANRARSALKKQQQQQQPPVLQPAAAPQPQQSHHPRQGAPSAAADSFVQTSQQALVAYGKHMSQSNSKNNSRHKPTTTTSRNGSVSPSPGSSRKAQTSYTPRNEPRMEIDNNTPCYNNGTAGGRRLLYNSYSSELARRLLQSMPLAAASDPTTSGRPHEEDQLRVFLTQQMTRTGTTTNGIVWGLVQQSVDYDNHQALALLQRALLWSPRTCQALVQAAGLDRPHNVEHDEHDNMMTDDDNDDPIATSLSSSSSTLVGTTIRCTKHKEQRRRHLEAIAANLKQPLALSSSSHALKSVPPPTTETGNLPFTPKQKFLARQLVAKLSEAIWQPCNTSASNNNTTSSDTETMNDTTIKQPPPLPHMDSIRVLAQLVSSISHASPSSKTLLEPAMVQIVARLEAHRQSLRNRHKQQQQESVARAYESLKQPSELLHNGDADGDDVMNEESDQADDQNTTKTGSQQTTKTNQQQQKNADSLPLEELDPMLIELCRQIGRLFPDAEDKDDDHKHHADDANANDESSQESTQEFVYQWRKAVLANACDLLEDDLVPLLLKLGSQAPPNTGGLENNNATNTNTGVPSPTVMATWQQWIPYLTSLVHDSSGRHLLRIQFPLHVTAATPVQATDGGSPATTTTNENDSMVVPNTTEQGSLSCSAMGVVVQLLHASVMIEQAQARRVAPTVLALCQTLRDQSIRCLHAWLQSHESRQQHAEISFLELLSDESCVEYYKSACAWILHQSTAAADFKNATSDSSIRRAERIDPDVVTMIRTQLEELMLDEEEAREEREERYSTAS